MKRRNYTTLLGIGTATLVLLAGCGVDKATEPNRDAPRGTTNTAPMDVVQMSDGFSNVGTKCDHGNRVYVVYHNDWQYGSVAVVAADPTCKGK